MGAKAIGGRMKLDFINAGNTLTTLSDVGWEIEHFPDLRIGLSFPSQIPHDLAPSALFRLEGEISIESEKGIVMALESQGGSARITFIYKTTTPEGDKAENRKVVRVVLV
jgi:hypothetical protein